MSKRALKRNCSGIGKLGMTFSVSSTPLGDTLVLDTSIPETTDMYTVEALAKRNELEYISIPSISDSQEIQNVVESLNTNHDE